MPPVANPVELAVEAEAEAVFEMALVVVVVIVVKTGPVVVPVDEAPAPAEEVDEATLTAPVPLSVALAVPLGRIVAASSASLLSLGTASLRYFCLSALHLGLQATECPAKVATDKMRSKRILSTKEGLKS